MIHGALVHGLNHSDFVQSAARTSARTRLVNDLKPNRSTKSNNKNPAFVEVAPRDPPPSFSRDPAPHAEYRDKYTLRSDKMPLKIESARWRRLRSGTARPSWQERLQGSSDEPSHRSSSQDLPYRPSGRATSQERSSARKPVEDEFDLARG